MEEINVKELKGKLDRKESFHLIDVREPFEYEEANIGGQLIPLGDIADHLEELEKWKDEEIVLMCRSGARSGNAQKFLQAEGFSKVYNLKGGILAWQEMEEDES
ncbi:rhodanese-like domain-containing protein [Membranicola marinus]|uniref:Rhodanese-like domain-containing protein n=1 Tax=Membranihabitans marinus TaxID=1227546 RepID=A0A953LBU0_9BACT|nr:rhodanese-like domain-containing protein [Membranihabitans marinus]MBY5957029.1 rhodanese-like domain-containing protein [Membranihabitans marinus]